MDSEKQSIDSVTGQKHYQGAGPTTPAPLKYLRAAQHTFVTISIALIACAMDRNIQIPGITGEEKALLSSSIFAFLVLIFHTVAPYKKTTTVVLDSLSTAFLFATFVYGAAQAGGNKGACAGPSKIGVWKNHIGCDRMSVATGFSAVGFATFAASTIVSAIKK